MKVKSEVVLIVSIVTGILTLVLGREVFGISDADAEKLLLCSIGGYIIYTAIQLFLLTDNSEQSAVNYRKDH